MALVTLTGGKFQDSDGSPLSNGFLLMRLSQDSRDPSTMSQIASGTTVRIPLGPTGNVSGTPKVWANDTLLPAGSLYRVTAFDSDGDQVWSNPQNLSVPSSPDPYNIGNWVPQI